MKTLAQVLSYKNLIGLIQAIVGSVPADIIPAGFLSITDNTIGNTGTYMKVEGTRETARIVHYGSPSQKRDLTGIAEVPVTLLHTFEHVSHPAALLQNLREEVGPMRQQMAKQTVSRQLGIFGQRFRNLRISAVYSALAKGAIYFDGEGNLLPSSTGAKVTIDFGVPAGNKSQLNVFGEGNILGAAWDAAGTDIPKQLNALHDAARELTGYPLRYAFYGKNVPSYLLTNNMVKAAIAGSPRLSENVYRGEIPDGLCGLTWVPANSAFYADNAGVIRRWFGDDQIVFAPEPSPEWWGVIEGSYVIPTKLDVMRDAADALASVDQVMGPFSYATLSDDPVSVKHFGGDTFLPVLKVPGAVFLAEVPTTPADPD